MALAKRYTSTFRTRTGVVVGVDLWQDGHVGGSTSFELAKSPLAGEAGEENQDELYPIRARVVTARVLTTAVLDAIYADSSAWEMRVSLDGAEFFRGPIIREGRTKSLNVWGPRTNNEIKATCGLGLLDGTTFYDATVSDGIAEADQKTIAGWIIYLLDKVGHGFDIYLASKFFALGMDNSETPEDPLSQVYLPARTWLVDGNLDRTLLDVLIDLLAAREMHVYQESEAWHCYQRSLFTSASFTRYQYDSGEDGETSGDTDSYSCRTTISDPSATRLKGGVIGEVAGFASASVLYRHGAIDNLVPNTQFERPSSGSAEATDWTRGDASAVDFVLRGPGTIYRGGRRAEDRAIWRVLRIDGMEVEADTEYSDLEALLDTGGNANNTLTQDNPTQFESNGVSAFAFSVSAFAELADEVVAIAPNYTPRTFAFLQVICQVGATTYWLRRTPRSTLGTWETSKNRVAVEIIGNGEATAQFVTEAPPGDGTIQVIYEGGATLPITPVALIPGGGDFNPPTSIYWNGDLTFVPVVDDANHGATETIIQVDGETGLRREAVETLHGTGPTAIHAGAMRKADGTLWNDWKDGSVPLASTGETHEQVFSNSIIRQTWDFLARIDATYRRTRVSPIYAHVESGVTYLPVYAHWDFKEERCTVASVEVKASAVTVAYDVRQDVPQGQVKTSQNEGASIVVDRLLAEANRITAVVEGLGEQIGTVGNDYGTAEVPVEVVEVVIDNLAYDLLDGDTLHIENQSTGKLYALTVDGAHSAGAEVAVSVDANVVHLDDGDPVKPGIIAGLRIELTGITVYGFGLYSDTFDGVIDAGTSEITDAGTVGWAITKFGTAVFNEVTVRGALDVGTIIGDLAITSGSITIDTDAFVIGATGLRMELVAQDDGDIPASIRWGSGTQYASVFAGLDDVGSTSLEMRAIDPNGLGTTNILLDANDGTNQSIFALIASSGAQITGGLTVDTYAVVTANSSIDALVDVDTTTAAPSTNDLLKWDGSNWVPGTVTGASGVSSIVASALIDVSGATGDVTVSVDLSELTEGGTMVGTDSVVVLDGGVQAYVSWENVPASILSGYGTFPDGLVATPSIAFTDDTDTGLYRVGADTIGVTAGGALQLSISTTVANFQDNGIVTTGGVQAGIFTVAQENSGVVSSSVSRLDQIAATDAQAWRVWNGTTTYLTANTSAGAIDFGVDLSVPSGERIYLDGRSNTYIHESASDTIQFVTGGFAQMTLSTASLNLESNALSGVTTGAFSGAITSTAGGAFLNNVQTGAYARFGNTRVGAYWTASSAYAAFGHDSKGAAIDGIAIAQSSSGETYLNSSSGFVLHFQIAAADEMTLSATTLDLKSNALTTTGSLTGASLALSGAITGATTGSFSSNVSVAGNVLSTGGTGNIGSVGTPFANGYFTDIVVTNTFKAHSLEAEGTNPLIVIDDSDAATDTAMIGWVSFGRGGAEKGAVGYTSAISLDFDITSAVGDIVITPSSDVVVDGVLTFGTAKDTNLYRSAANTLKTDDAFVLGSTLTLGGNILAAATGYDVGSSGTRIQTLYGETINISGEIDAGAGTASDPSYTFAGDTDTGIYRVAANELGFAAGGALTAKVTSAGLIPAATVLLGDASNRWNGIYGTLLDLSTTLAVSGDATFSGDILAGAGTEDIGTALTPFANGYFGALTVGSFTSQSYTVSGENLGIISSSVSRLDQVQLADAQAYRIWDGTTTFLTLDSATGAWDMGAGTVTAGGFSGSGASLTALNAGNVSTGTLALARGGTGTSLSDPGGDRILFWDDVGAEALTWLSMGTAISISGTSLNVTLGSGGAQAYNATLQSIATAGYVNATYLDGVALTITSPSNNTYIRYETGTGYVNAAVDYSHLTNAPTFLGLAGLSDPGADRILFWDDTAGAVAWLEIGSGLSISGTEITSTGGVTVHDTPVNGATTAAISSNWAYDHANASNPHSITWEMVKGSRTSGAVGDIIYGNGLTSWGVLSPGSSGHVLKTQGAGFAPVWGTLSYSDVGAAASSHNHAGSAITSGTVGAAYGGTGISRSGAVGDIIYGNGLTSWGTLGAGTGFLLGNGAGFAPTWQSLGVGVGLDIGSYNITLDLSELTEITSGIVGTDHIIVLDSGTEKRARINGINLTAFNNDLTAVPGNLDVPGLVSTDEITDSGAGWLYLSTTVVTGPIRPVNNGLWDLGSSSYEWANVYAVDGTFSGDITCNDLTETSDRRLKDNIVPITGGLATLRDLVPVTYTLRAKPEAGPQAGFVAQQVAGTWDYAVRETPAGLGLRYSAFSALAVAAVQELDRAVSFVSKAFDAFAVEAGQAFTSITDRLETIESLVLGFDPSRLLESEGSPQVGQTNKVKPDTVLYFTVEGRRYRMAVEALSTYLSE